MQDIERILTDADVKPTAIRMMVMKEIIAIGHTFTLSDDVRDRRRVFEDAEDRGAEMSK